LVSCRHGEWKQIFGGIANFMDEEIHTAKPVVVFICSGVENGEKPLKGF
jgi:hypothetical protein